MLRGRLTWNCYGSSQAKGSLGDVGSPARGCARRWRRRKKPLMVSKLNTVAQVGFAALVLASLGFGFQPHPYDLILMGLVTIFTLGSVSLYLVEWVRHMSTIEAR